MSVLIYQTLKLSYIFLIVYLILHEDSTLIVNEDLQSSKQFLSIYLTDDGILIFDNLVQLLRKYSQ